MNDEFDFSTGLPSSEMSQYLQLFLDETSEQLDALVESLLVLESHPTDAEQLNEAFRLIHSIKGSAGMMGLDGITVLTHHLENHFERLRSGLQTLDERALGLILRCIDFLRECNRRLRAGTPLASAPELLDELNGLAVAPEGGLPTPTPAAAQPPAPSVAAVVSSAEPEPVVLAAVVPAPTASTPTGRGPVTVASHDVDYLIVVTFEPELPLADLKAELVLARLAEIAAVRETWPLRDELANVSALTTLQVLLSSDHPETELRSAADVDGVRAVEAVAGAREFLELEPSESAEPKATAPTAAPTAAVAWVSAAPQIASAEAVTVPVADHVEDRSAHIAVADVVTPTAVAEASGAEPRSRVAETVRVDIGRLDRLMNLAGELVVNKARFVQIARQMSPVFKKTGAAGRVRSFGDSMRRALQLMKTQAAAHSGESAANWDSQIQELEAGIEALEEQSRLWEASRRSFTQFHEAIDQMSRVSNSLQRGVLETRMVPVAPLFNRFKRVVRDISLELGKRVNLEIHGEHTELDKRMIDELGDPLVHLVRNAIDHGIESSEVRRRAGKPETGAIRLSAAHSGNNVLISVADDGGGIPVEKVRRRIVERGLVAESVAEGLSEREVVDFIWHPGFSTADAVSDISGRGVGMDIVKTRIAELNGTIEIEHVAGAGTTFTIRLPLTLAIIHSLLFRLRHGVFAVPIDNVREIVSVPVKQVVSIHGRQTFEVRGEFIPLVDIDEIFDWHKTQYQYPGSVSRTAESVGDRWNVVILQSSEKTMGLKVNELQGGQDIVIKSLAENFVHIRGLSGASILGDGSVCLLLDVAAAIALAAGRGKKNREE
ncbi:MAG: chemotaxis protein CheA [Planctomycetes bacterium]|nr:chemotaxis protein CheA [Planctomycetota bacterium]